MGRRRGSPYREPPDEPSLMWWLTLHWRGLIGAGFLAFGAISPIAWCSVQPDPCQDAVYNVDNHGCNTEATCPVGAKATVEGEVVTCTCSGGE